MVELNIAYLLGSLLYFISVYIIVTLSLNLEAGYTGIPNFGKALFVAIGAFVVASLGGRLTAFIAYKMYPGEIQSIIENLHIQTLIPPDRSLASLYADPIYNRHAFRVLDVFLSEHKMLALSLLALIIVLAMAIGGIAGLLASYPALRLRGEYLAILLLAVSELMVMSIGLYWKPLVGGETGLFLPNYLSILGDRFIYGVTGIITVAAILLYLYAQRIANSPAGRLMRAVRDDDLAASSLGKDIARVRRDVIIISSSMAALAGALAAIYTGSVVASHYQRMSWTFIPWAMMIIGGVANNTGIVLGVIAVLALQKLVDLIKGSLSPILPFDPTWLYYLALGIIIIVMLYLRPQGILPEKPSKTVNFEEILDNVLEESVEDEQARRLIKEGKQTP